MSNRPEFSIFIHMSPLLKSPVFLLALFCWHLSFAQAKHDPATAATPEISLFVFLSPECPLCQNYTRTLNLLDKQYAGKLTIHGIIPGKTWKQTDLSAFAAKYHIAYPLQIDSDLHLAHSMHATTTPEAILLAPDNTVLYQGAIDNWYKALGRSQNHPTQNYLQDAIDSALHHQPAAIKHTTPVGCLINDY